MDRITALTLLKKISFSKSWQNTFVDKEKGIVNLETGKIEKQALEVFVFIPALKIIQLFSNDKAFLTYRMDNKFSDRFNFNLVADKTDNTNRRLAIMYVADMLEALGIKFLIDDVFTLYINNDELQKMSESTDADIKAFYNALYIPKVFAQRKGASETFS
jgi:hypothetical protein